MGLGVRDSWRDDGSDGGYVKRGAVAEVEMRIAVTELVQRAVEVLGRQVSGNLLTGPALAKDMKGVFVFVYILIMSCHTETLNRNKK